MIEKEDYRKYLSVDNGKGLLLGKNDTLVLERYGIDYWQIAEMSDLILIVGQFVDDHSEEEIEDLEEVLEHLMETYYYNKVRK